MSLLLWGGSGRAGKLQRFVGWRRPLDARDHRLAKRAGYLAASLVAQKKGG